MVGHLERRSTRRAFLRGSLALAGLTLLAGCGMRAPEAKPSRVARVGVLWGGTGGSTSGDSFRQGLRDLGYVEGATIALEERWAEGRTDRYLGLAAELANLQPDVILVPNTEGALAARQVTETIPIVMASSTELVGTGLIESLARPGRNVTGLTFQIEEISEKRVELFKEAIPGLSRLAILWYQPRRSLLERTEDAARRLGIVALPLEMRDPPEFTSAFDEATRWGAQGVITIQGVFFSTHNLQIAELALRSRLPTMSGEIGYARSGGLMNYGPNIAGDFYRRAATYVDKILKGAKPGDLPVEQPTRFDFVINLKTAQGLALTIPQAVLQQSTEIIQ